MEATRAYSALLDLLPKNKHRAKRRKVELPTADDSTRHGEAEADGALRSKHADTDAALGDDAADEDDQAGEDAFDLQYVPGTKSEEHHISAGDGVRYIVTRSDDRKCTVLKQRLKQRQAAVSGTYKEIEDHCLSYRDVIYPVATHDQQAELRRICTLHVANHVLKLRDRILKNNARAAEVECRDQGFTRPTVLILLPTRNACLNVVNLLLGHLGPEQVENRRRFDDEFGIDADPLAGSSKPADFRAAFAGNTDDAFRLGLKVTRKTVKLFSAFYNSDVILASPLGLRTLKEYDFLSSIGVLVVDGADALSMQNWAHVEHFFAQLNNIPKEQHGCDFARVRTAYLDGRAKEVRQTILLSAYDFPEMRALPLQNWAGRLRIVPEFELGAVDRVGVPVVQQFSRIDGAAAATSGKAHTAADDPDRRFDYFSAAIVPKLAQSKGTLLFVPSYFDFCRMRNHLRALQDASASAASVEAVSEYTAPAELTRARHLFADGRVDVLLITERLQYYRRYVYKGVQQVVFYQLPEHAPFYTELARAAATATATVGVGSGGGSVAEGGVKALFSHWDHLRLERIVGSRRARKMAKGQDSYEFR